MPTLTEMSLAALNVLDNDPDGLYLMIEGGAVDWAAHANQSGRMIEEAIEFERAVEAVLDWVQTNSNWGETLLIVTGDHETGYLTGPDSGQFPGPRLESHREQRQGRSARHGMAFAEPHEQSDDPIGQGRRRAEVQHLRQWL